MENNSGKRVEAFKFWSISKKKIVSTNINHIALVHLLGKLSDAVAITVENSFDETKIKGLKRCSCYLKVPSAAATIKTLTPGVMCTSIYSQ